MFDWPIECYRWLFLQLSSHIGLGWAIVFLSFICSALMSPLMKTIAGVVRRETDYQNVILPQIAKINETYATDKERHLHIERLYMRYDYSPLFAVKKVLPLLAQIPFLLLTYYMLKGTPEINGVPFLFLRDLGRPDALIARLNILPFLMTSVNVLTVFSTPGFSRRDRFQAIGIALLFLVLLYNAPSALLLYWTLNNVLSLIKALTGNRCAGAVLLGRRFARLRYLHSRLAASAKCAYDTYRKWVERCSSERDSAICTSVVVGSLVAFYAMILLPVQTYSMNCKDFDVSLSAVFGESFVGFVVLSLIVSLVLRFSVHRLGYVLHAIILGCVLACMLESGPMAFGLGTLDGNFEEYRSARRSVFDALVVAVAIILPIFKMSFSQRRVVMMSFLLAIYMIASAVLSFSSYLRRTNDISACEFRFVARADVLNSIRLSTNENVILIILDSVTTEVCQELFKKTPELRECFPGFVNFANNLGMGWRTPIGIPGIFTGQYWNPNTEDYAGYCRSVYSDLSFITDYIRRGHSVFISTGPGREGYANVDEITTSKADKTPGLALLAPAGGTFPVSIVELSAFRIIPYALKELFIKSVFDYRRKPIGEISPANGRPIGDRLYENDQEVWRKLSTLKPKEANKVLCVIHTSGGHPPFLYDHDGSAAKIKDTDYNAYLSQCTYVFRLLAEMFAKWKVSGVYDNSAIIICADHGLQISKTRNRALRSGAAESLLYPCLMVKTRDAQGDYKESSVPTSHSRISRFVKELAKKTLTTMEAEEMLASPGRYCRDVHASPVCDYYVNDAGEIKTLVVDQDSGNDRPLTALKLLRLYSFNPFLHKANYPDFICQGGEVHTGEGVECWVKDVDRHMLISVRVPSPNQKYRLRMNILPVADFRDKGLQLRVVANNVSCDHFSGMMVGVEEEVYIEDVISDEKGTIKVSFDVMNVSGKDCYCSFVLKSIIVESDIALKDGIRVIPISRENVLNAELDESTSESVVRCRGALDRSWKDNDLIGYIVSKQYKGIKVTLENAERYETLRFWGRKASGCGQPTVVARAKSGLARVLFAKGYKALDNEWHEYVVDISELKGRVDVIFNGAYTDRTGTKDSVYLFKGIRLTE